MKARWAGTVSVLVLAAVLFAAVAMMPSAPAAAQAPMSNQMTVSVYPAASISGTTVNTSAPNIDAEARDVSLTTGLGVGGCFCDRRCGVEWDADGDGAGFAGRDELGRCGL